jgi:hypothetical protein
MKVLATSRQTNKRGGSNCDGQKDGRVNNVECVWMKANKGSFWDFRDKGYWDKWSKDGGDAGKGEVGEKEGKEKERERRG